MTTEVSDNSSLDRKRKVPDHTGPMLFGTWDQIAANSRAKRRKLSEGGDIKEKQTTETNQQDKQDKSTFVSPHSKEITERSVQKLIGNRTLSEEAKDSLHNGYVWRIE